MLAERQVGPDTRIGLARSADDPNAVLSFMLGTVASADRERVRELHRRYFAELRALIADSQPGDVVLLANVQLVELTRDAAHEDG